MSALSGWTVAAVGDMQFSATGMLQGECRSAVVGGVNVMLSPSTTIRICALQVGEKGFPNIVFHS